MPDPQLQLSDVIKDPDVHSKFRMLSPADQSRFLGMVSPEYTQFPADKQEAFRDKFLNYGKTVTDPLTPNAILQNQGPDYRDPLQAVNTAVNTGKAAVSGLEDTASSIGQGIKNWWNAPTGKKVADVVFSPLTAGESLISGLGNTANDVKSESTNPNVPVDQRVLNVGSVIAGGNPEAARQAAATGDFGAANWQEFGKPIAASGAAELGARAIGSTGDLFSGQAARSQNRAMASMIAPGVKGEIPEVVAQRITPLYQQAAKELGIKNRGGTLDKMFTSDMPTRVLPTDKSTLGKPLATAPKALDIANKAVDIADKPLDTVMKVAGSQPIDPQVKQSILNELQSNQSDYTRLGDHSSANAIDSQIQSVKDAKTYGDLNDLKANANKKIEGMFSNKTPSGQASATVQPIWTYRELGNSIRQNMYPAIQDYAGTNFDLKTMGQREADAMDARDGIYSNYYKMGGSEANVEAKKYLEKAIDEGSLYKSHVFRKLALINPTPAGQFNKYFRRGLGELGEGGSPESVNIVQNKQPLQLQAPPGSQPFQFDIPTGIAQEGTQGSSGVVPIKQYAGQTTVQNPNFSPISGPSHFQQEQELGSTASTIPQSVRGAQSPARVQADQVGMGHTPNAAAQQENFNNWKSDFQNTYGKPPSAQDIGLYQQTHANIPNAYPRATMPGLTGEVPSTRQQAFTGSPTVSQSNFQSLTGASEPTQTVTNNGVGVLKTGDPEIARTHLNNAVNKMMNQDFFGLAADKQQGVIDQIHNVKSIKDVQNLGNIKDANGKPYLKSTFNKMSDDQKLRFVQDFNNLDQQLGKYNLGQGLRGGSPVSVKWTKADLGTVPQKGAGITKRVASNAARVILSPPPQETVNQ